VVCRVQLLDVYLRMVPKLAPAGIRDFTPSLLRRIVPTGSLGGGVVEVGSGIKREIRHNF
jgi:hypothetical protein